MFYIIKLCRNSGKVLGKMTQWERGKKVIEPLINESRRNTFVFRLFVSIELFRLFQAFRNIWPLNRQYDELNFKYLNDISYGKNCKNYNL